MSNLLKEALRKATIASKERERREEIEASIPPITRFSPEVADKNRKFNASEHLVKCNLLCIGNGIPQEYNQTGNIGPAHLLGINNIPGHDPSKGASYFVFTCNAPETPGPGERACVTNNSKLRILPNPS
jgi:hypothetical protein